MATNKKAVRTKPLTPKVGVTRNGKRRYESGGKMKKKCG